MAKLRLDQIRLDGGTQMRVGPRNEEALAEYAEAVQSGTELPPVTVFFDGHEYWLADGFHRHTVYKNLGQHYIPVDVKQGSKRDAVLFAVGANASHGLRRTNTDKRRAVETLLKDEEWTTWVDAEIARRANVSAMSVGRIRKELISNKVIDSSPIRTTQRDGKAYTQNTQNIGSKPQVGQSEHGVASQPSEPERAAEPKTQNTPPTEPTPMPSAPPPAPPKSIFKVETPPDWIDPTKPSPLEARVDAFGKALEKVMDFHKEDIHGLLREKYTQVSGVTRLAQLTYELLGDWLGAETPESLEEAIEREAKTITVGPLN